MGFLPDDTKNKLLTPALITVTLKTEYATDWTVVKIISRVLHRDHLCRMTADWGQLKHKQTYIII